MKTAGSLIVGIGLLIAIGLAVFPTSITMLGSSSSCGVPAFTAFADTWDPNASSDFAQRLTQQCVSQSRQRLFAAIGVGVGSLLVGLAIGVAGDNSERRARARKELEPIIRDGFMWLPHEGRWMSLEQDGWLWVPQEDRWIPLPPTQ